MRFAICGAAPASVELLEAFESRYGIPIIEGYGLSEGSCASTVNPLDGKRKPGTVGLPAAGSDDPHRRRGGDAGARRRGRRGCDQGPQRDARLPEPARGDREDGRRRLAAHRRRRPVRRGRLPGPGRPRQGHDHPRRREHLPPGDRGRRPPAAADRRGRRRRTRQRGLRRGAGAVRVAAPRTDARHRRDPRAPQRVVVEIQTAGGDHDPGRPPQERRSARSTNPTLRKRPVETR